MTTRAPRDDAPEAITWDYAIPLLQNRFLWGDFLSVTVLSLLLIQGLLLLTGWLLDGEALIIPLQFWGLIVGILLLLYILAELILGNRFHARFTLDAEGVTLVMGARERKTNRILLILGLLAGNLRVIGASLAGQGQQSSFTAWKDVRRLRAYPAERVITLSNTWRPLARLYLPATRWAEVLARVEREVGAQEERRARLRARTGGTETARFSWSRVALWSVLCLLATLAGVAWPWAEDWAYRLMVIAGVLALLGGVSAGVAGWLCCLGSLGATLAVTAALGSEALRAFPSLFDGQLRHTYELDTPQLALSCAGCALLLGLCAWRMFTPAGRSAAAGAERALQGAEREE
jgi:hypothetical protein